MKSVSPCPGMTRGILPQGQSPHVQAHACTLPLQPGSSDGRLVFAWPPLAGCDVLFSK